MTQRQGWEWEGAGEREQTVAEAEEAVWRCCSAGHRWDAGCHPLNLGTGFGEEGLPALHTLPHQGLHQAWGLGSRNSHLYPKAQLGNTGSHSQGSSVDRCCWSKEPNVLFTSRDAP